jgi:hypothetical protein
MYWTWAEENLHWIIIHFRLSGYVIFLGYIQGYFCDGMYWNAILEVLSQTDRSQNGVPDLFSLALV